MEWARWKRSSWGGAQGRALDWLHHIPNGGPRSKAAAGKLKAEGVRAGVSDYFLPAACGGYFGLYIELKAKGGRTTPDQREFIAYTNGAGFLAVVAVGWEQAAAAVEQYLEKPRTQVLI